jgi:4-amino-4-deoxy-L-arabinose transferase-like glycosyltransferase
MRRSVLAVLVAVALLRVPFLNQAIQGDDSFYLAGAQHAQIDPAHPHHATYVFRGDIVEMRGHPHPPLNTWTLALLLAVFGDVYEVPFHAAYILFSAMAALAMLALARRFTARALSASLLFLATPAFVVNGNSLESDLPFLAFWMAATALYVQAVEAGSWKWLAAACAAMAGASMAAYQSVVLVPILALYLWLNRRRWEAGWAVLLVIPATLGLWQMWERLSTGAAPAAVLAGYMHAYNFQQISAKLRNAAALTAHLAWLVFPPVAAFAFGRSQRKLWIVAGAAGLGGAFIDPNPLFWVSFGLGVFILAAAVRTLDFLTAWLLVFFAAALVLFFAGSARYLLPVAAPVALLITRRLEDRPGWLWGAIAVQAALSVSLAIVNYDHWDGYRRFARSLPHQEGQRVWVNGEWGLRFYLESKGALPLVRGQALRPSEMVVTSRLASPADFTTGGGRLAAIQTGQIRPRLPIRLIALDSKSGYSDASRGLRPFDIGTAPADEIRASVVVERKPTLSFLPMSAPEAETQIVSGVYQLESASRWMAQHAVILLKPPVKPSPLRVGLYIAPQTPARKITLSADGSQVAEATFPGPGLHALVSPMPVHVAGDVATITITVDRTFVPQGDRRTLGVVLADVGFMK